MSSCKCVAAADLRRFRYEPCSSAVPGGFGTLKSKFFYLNKFASVEELQQGLVQYIHYYNHDRIKLKLKGLSPVKYRTQPSKA
ncbi:hypothetical protein CO2235_10259 [Cupriavidus oxalaticus]|uniref:Integrase catalytic domain-containing protein n=1 Tax=Cupriavidus oxalaticus TaxID=96344 RepID=A0A976B906_9BURK|nr:hypothetical protein CO2235_10259 [Cupriavidus oxalaticus]